MSIEEFHTSFEALTANSPFPWQEALYQCFVAGSLPTSCNIPTGLGKTAVIPIWLIALANHPRSTPRRLVYVVNRRTVVDQATDETRRIRERLVSERSAVPLKEKLRELCSARDGIPLAISTLRGQFADNREWSADPSRPAVVVGTVDMIGSRLLFSGYRVGFRARPMHAAFLGQDSLLIHDEAHLEPAFQTLLDAITSEQQSEAQRTGVLPWPGLRVVELTATSRMRSENGAQGKVFELTGDEKSPPEVIPDPPTEPIHYIWRRIKAKKKLHLHSIEDKHQLADKIARLAEADHTLGQAVLVFVERVEDVKHVVKKLPKGSAEPLTGTLRGLERDGLLKTPVFQRFLPGSSRDPAVTPTEGTVYLVCTSAGEVGVNISADHLVCDLSTFESMAQRFGRVNRFGDRPDTRIDIVHAKEFDEKDELGMRLKMTLDLLRALNGDGSPAALDRLDPEARGAAFSPTPICLPTTDILFDAWALTSVRDQLPGRPTVEPYLHGIREHEPPETYVAWREEVDIIANGLDDIYKPIELLDDYPLKPHELLRDKSDRVYKHLVTLAGKHPDSSIWLLDDDGTIVPLRLEELVDKNRKERINNRTVLLPPSIGGLRDGSLDGGSAEANDVADRWIDDQGNPRRKRAWNPDEAPPGMRLVRVIDTRPDADVLEEGDEESLQDRFWYWYVQPISADDEGSRTSQEPVRSDTHTRRGG